MLPAFSVERGGNEVAHALAGVAVLGGEKPVVGLQRHRPADVHGLGQQPAGQRPGVGGLHLVGEEDPDVGPAAGLGDFQGRGDLEMAGRLGVGQGVEQGRGAVEVGRDKVATVVVGQRVQAKVLGTAQVRFDGGGGQTQVVGVLPVHPLAPASGDGGHPPELPALVFSQRRA